MSATIDHKAPAFQEFQRIVNARNDFVHANVTEKMMRPFVSLDGFAFADFDDDEELPLSDRLPELDMDDIAGVQACVDAVVAHVLAHMNPTYREPLRAVLLETYLGVALVDGRYVVQPPD